nr:tellurium resistance protein TerW [uncultured Pantoea sp.]
MSLSAKQYRQYRLVVLLSTGKPVKKEVLLQEMACSEPTFVRDLRDIRHAYHSEIRFSKSAGHYQMISAGTLTPKIIKMMRDSLDLRDRTATGQQTQSSVVLDKEAKKSVSLSLRLSVLRKIQLYANRYNLNRSQVIELLVEENLSKPPKKS